MAQRICKDGRIWGQNNRYSSSHLGKVIRPRWVRKGPVGIHWWRTGSEFKKGKLHPKWKDGLTPIIGMARNSIKYKQWRSDVYKRDSWTCQTCNKRGGPIQAHHIKPFVLIMREHNITDLNTAFLCDELWDVSNGVTLCKDCHKLTDNHSWKKSKKERC